MKRHIYIMLLLASAGYHAQAQSVKTFSGVAYNGNGWYRATRPNTLDSEYYSNPYGIETDTSGKLYVTNEHNIFMLYNGKSKLMAGYNLDPTWGADYKNATGTVARFSRPAGLAVNPSTNDMIIADQENNLIRSLTPFQNMFTDPVAGHVAGVKLVTGAFLDGTTAAAKFNMPQGVAVNTNGDIYVADRDNHCIRKISNGNVSTIAGSAGNSGSNNGTGTGAKFDAPVNLYLESSSSLLVADYNNKAIRRIDLSNNNVTTLVSTGLNGPTDMCRMNSYLYITDGLTVKVYDGSTVKVFAGNENLNGNVDGPGTDARFEHLTSIVYNKKDGFLYVVDQGNNVIKRIDPSAKPVADFTASSTNITVGQNIVVKSTSQNNPLDYKWTISPGTYQLLNNSQHDEAQINVAFTTTGAYTIKLWVSNNAGPDSLVKTSYITVSSSTAAPVVDFVADKTSLQVNNSTGFTDLSSNSPQSWKWVFEPNTVTYLNGTDSSSRFPVVKFNAAGLYKVSLTATNGTGSNTTSKTDYINVTPNTGVKTVAAASLKVYPNPVSNILHIESEESEYTAVLYSLDGRQVTSVANGENIDVSSMPKGMYMLKLHTSSGKAAARLVVVE